MENNYRVTKTGAVHLAKWVKGPSGNDHVIMTLCGRTDVAAPLLPTADGATCKQCLKIAPHGTDLTVTPMGTKLPPGNSAPKISSDAARITVDAPTVPVVTVWCEFCPPATIAPATMEAQMPNGASVALCADTVCRERAEANNAAAIPAMAEEVSPYAAGDRVHVEHEGSGTVISVDECGITVRIDRDGVSVEAAFQQVRRIVDAETVAVRALMSGDSTDANAAVEALVALLPAPVGAALAEDVSPYAASVTRYLVKNMAYGPMDAAAVVVRFADMVDRGDRFGSNVDYIAWEISSADYKADMAPASDAAQDAIDVAQAATGIHEACGLPMADHCAFCDVCPIPSEKCGCGECGDCGGNPAECGAAASGEWGDCGGMDTIGATSGQCRGCGNDASHDAECPTDGPPVIVEARQGAGYVIPRGVADGGEMITGAGVARWQLQRARYALRVADGCGQPDGSAGHQAAYLATLERGYPKHKIIGARRRRNSRKGK